MGSRKVDPSKSKLVCYVILIAGIFPQVSSNGAHGSQSDDSTYLALIYAVVFTSPLTSRLCSQLQELQELPTSPLRMWSSSKKHQLLLTWAPGPGVEPRSRGHEADALPLSYPHIPQNWFICSGFWSKANLSSLGLSLILFKM